MRLYISCDMEGTAGVCSWVQCDPQGAEYPIYRRYMSLEVRAAIDGAREAGATECVINDSHWNMRNLLWDELPADVRVISGSRKPYSMTQGMDGGFDGIFFTGYHAAAGVRDGVLAHTYSSETIYEVRVNGVACSEALLNAALAGAQGIPLLLISGDRAIVDHVRGYMPWVTGVTVKDGIGHYSAQSLTPQAAQQAIREGARRAVATAREAEPFTFAPPYSLEIDTTRAEQADFIELMPGFQRVSGRTVRYDGSQDFHAVFRAFVAAMRLGGAATAPA